MAPGTLSGLPLGRLWVVVAVDDVTEDDIPLVAASSISRKVGEALNAGVWSDLTSELSDRLVLVLLCFHFWKDPKKAVGTWHDVLVDILLHIGLAALTAPKDRLNKITK